MKCNKKKIFGELFSYFICLIIMWYIAETLLNSKEIIHSVHQSIIRCISVLIPSLFGLMVISDLIIRTGIYQKISILFYPISRFIFRLPYPLFFVFLLGNIAGYPIGIKLLTQLVEKNSIDKKTAERMSLFCFNSGPAFVIGTVGIAIFSSVKIGLIIYMSCLIANIICGIICGLVSKYTYNHEDTKVTLSAENLVLSVQSSGKSMLMVCLMVVFSSSTIRLLDCVHIFAGLSEKTEILVFSLLEITNITTLTSSYKLIPVITFLVGFGGICVLLQLTAICKNKFSILKFVLIRIPISLLASIISYLFIIYLPIAEYCMENYYYTDKSSNTNVFSIICLICMIIIIFFRKKTSNSD